MIDVVVGHLKELVSGHQCLIIGWEWKLDLKNKLVRAVLSDSILKAKFMKELEEQIDPGDFRFIFNPDKINFTFIKAQKIIPVHSLTRNYFDNKIHHFLVLFIKLANVLELIAGL
jgi:hypothetical protein